ncbi:hypothetical protein ACFSKL_19110 [Belliella marina]|uniref:Lipoprotein n=1 Tax=Belliella marina TaxID=1644146 RepID=A0ABW4VRM7_9BACT
MRNLIFVLMGFALLGCSEDAEDVLNCGVDGNMIEKIEWLNIEADRMNSSPETNGIVLYKYEGREVIELQEAIRSSTNQTQFHCDGTRIDFNDSDKFSDYLQNRVELKVLFGTKIWN